MFYPLQKSSSTSWIVCLCLLYLLVQTIYLPFAIFSDDDLWLAFHTYQFHDALPYRDFAPYKTVLGYYVLLLPLSLFHGVILPLINTKLFLALLNTVFFLLSARWLTRYLSPAGVLLSLSLILFSSLFLSYATEIRVDMLAYWCCLFGALWIISGRMVLAGLFLSTAFLISQKAFWHIAAIDVGLWVILFSKDRWFSVRSFGFFHLALIIPLMSYIAIWAALSSMHTVLHSMFYEAYLVSALESYNAFRAAFWQMSLTNNPIFFMLFPITLWSVLTAESDSAPNRADKPREDGYAQRLFLFVYGFILTLWTISYKQPFLYNMIVLVPAYFLLYAAFFDWLCKLFHSTASTLLISKKSLMILTGCYLTALIVTICYFSLPVIYVTMGLVPLFLTRYLLCQPEAQFSSKPTTIAILTAVILLLGIIFPVTRFVGSLDEMNGTYQKDMLFLAHQLTQNEGDYVAGVALFHDKASAIPGLKHLCLSALEYLYQPNDTLRRTMTLSSLYFSPNNPDEIIAALKQSNIKFYVNNNRFVQLPEKIKTYLQSEYQHFWGSIYLYAPTFHANQTRIHLKFTGKYRLVSDTTVNIDHKKISPNASVTFVKGSHRASATQAYRLQWLPDTLVYSLLPEHHDDTWERMLF